MVFADPAAWPESASVAPELALEGDGNGSPPVLAGFALLGGAWWVAVSEPAAPRSRQRPVGRRPVA